MTESEFNAELAWDIQEWGAPDKLSLGEVRSLAAFLTEKGYHKGKATGLSGLFSTLEETGTRLVDEFGPLIDSLRKPK